MVDAARALIFFFCFVRADKKQMALKPLIYFTFWAFRVIYRLPKFERSELLCDLERLSRLKLRLRS